MKSLRGKLLVSSVRLGDPNFARTVVLMVAHDENGALGLVLNRSLGVPIVKLAQEVTKEPTPREGMLYRGGPCESAVMVLYDQDANISPEGGSDVTAGLRFTGHASTIESLLRSADGDVRFFIGYSGWSGGQLEGELAEEAWLTLPARAEHVFSDPDLLWEMARAELVLGGRVNPAIIPPDPNVN